MIRLIAFTPRDGWALVRQGEEWWHLQPPYRRADRRLLDEHMAARALMEQGFEARDEPFADWGTLTRALVQDQVRALDSRERKATLSAWRAVLGRTTAARARAHLQTLATWIEEGDDDAAEQVLMALSTVPAVQGDADLVAGLDSLLLRISLNRRSPIPEG